MGKPAKFDMGAFAQRLAPAGERSLDDIANNILRNKQVGGEALLAIGRDLIEVKGRLAHGEWLDWLTEKVSYSPRTAQKIMKLARDWTNTSTLAYLSASKAFDLLALPESERDAFIRETHVVDGEEKTVIDMTSRELEKAIRERDEARRAAEAAQTDARTAEESRAKMEADMKALEEIHRSAQEGEAQARDALAKAQAELKELRERPMDVAVETVVDEEAVKKARADAIAEMQAKVARAEGLRKDAEKKRKEAEMALKNAQGQANANAAAAVRAEKAEAELALARRQLEKAAKAEAAAEINQDGDLAMFGLLFSQGQETFNKMHGLKMKLVKRNKDLEPKLNAAMSALVENARRLVE